MRKLLVAIVLLSPTMLWCQTSDLTFFSGYLKESFFYPSKHNFGSPLHPGVTIGFEKLLKDKTRVDQLLTAEIGFYHHDYLQNGLFVLGGYQFRSNPISNIFAWVQPQLGYLHTWSPSGEFKLEDGQYVATKSGHPSAFAGLTLGLDYQIIPAYESKVFVSYRMMVEGPFALEYGVPVVPHTFLSIGLKSKISSK